MNDVVTQFRAGHYEAAAAAAEAILSAAVADERAHDVIDALFAETALQPLFPDRGDARRALGFYRWLVAAMESLAGHHAECVAFAQARLAAAFAVADDTDSAAKTLAEMFARGREAAAIAPSRRTPAPTHTDRAFPAGVTHQVAAQPEPPGMAATEAHPPAMPATSPLAPPPTTTPDPCPHLAPVLDHARSFGATIAATVSADADSAWIYLDNVVLYVANLVDRFALPAPVIVHSELTTGPRPAHGLLCTEHGCAVLGAHPLRGANKTIVG